MKLRRGYIEYFLADHCNLRCAQCSHYSPYMKPWTPALEDFRRDLSALSEVMEVGRFRFLGGEPLLNRELPAFLAAVRESGFARQVGICTNGLLLHKTSEEVLRSLDWLDVSVYPGTIPEPDAICRTAEEIGRRFSLPVNLFRKPEFRYQILDHEVGDPDTVKAIYRSCKMAHGGWDMFHDGCHTFYQGSYYRCNRPAYARRYLESQGLEVDLPDFAAVDGVPLHAPDLRERLLEYLLRDEPMESCRWCLGTCGVKLPHRMLTPAEVRHRAPREVALADVLDPEAMRQDLEILRPIRSRTRRTLLSERAPVR